MFLVDGEREEGGAEGVVVVGGSWNGMYVGLT
jgi:hypothetical protein